MKNLQTILTIVSIGLLTYLFRPESENKKLRNIHETGHSAAIKNVKDPEQAAEEAGDSTASTPQTSIYESSVRRDTIPAADAQPERPFEDEHARLITYMQ